MFLLKNDKSAPSAKSADFFRSGLMNNKAALFLPPCLISLFVGGLYLRTISPGLTWAYDGADGGDFLAALATGGVPHPGGYPTYMLLASLFTKLPLGSLALRGNLFSLICMTLAVFLFYKLVLLLTDSPFLSSFSSLLFGTFPLVWSQALITEVYALQTLLSVLVVLLFASKHSSRVRNFAGGLMLGLVLGNHLTSLLLLPLIFWDDRRKISLLSNLKQLSRVDKAYFQHILGRLAGTCLGLSVYLVIPLRARNQAPVNWGNAVDWEGFWWLVSGEMYFDRLHVVSPAYLFAGLQAWSRFMLDQAGIVGVAIGLFVLITLYKRSPIYVLTGWLFLAWSAFAILYRSPDSYVYLIPALMAMAIWIGMGIHLILERFPLTKNVYIRPLLRSITIVLILARAISMIPEMDLSSDRKAEQYAQAVLASLPDRAIVATEGDEALFSLWYFQYVDRQRPDVAIVSQELMGQPWYHEVLKYTYLDLNVPERPWIQSLGELNPQRPVCFLMADLQPRFSCLP